jgi:hypothetical protein
MLFRSSVHLRRGARPRACHTTVYGAGQEAARAWLEIERGYQQERAGYHGEHIPDSIEFIICAEPGFPGVCNGGSAGPRCGVIGTRTGEPLALTGARAGEP